MTAYTYLGDRLTDPALRGQRCTVCTYVNRKSKRVCIRSGGKQLVQFEDGRRVAVLAYLLRKIAVSYAV